MEEIIAFLRQLRSHNERSWFMEHKDVYQRCVKRFEEITAGLIAGVESFDDSVRGLQPKDCT